MEDAVSDATRNTSWEPGGKTIFVLLYLRAGEKKHTIPVHELFSKHVGAGVPISVPLEGQWTLRM